jgi:hypothetical protein
MTPHITNILCSSPRGFRRVFGCEFTYNGLGEPSPLSVLRGGLDDKL